MNPNRPARHLFPLVPTLLFLAGLAGCGSNDPGWVRLQPGLAGARDEILFEGVSAAAPPAKDRESAPQPLVVHAEDITYNLNDEPIRSRWLLALVEPTQAANKVQFIAVVGKAERRAAPAWQLYVGQKDVGFWRYAKRAMLQGQVSQPSGMGLENELEIAACLRPNASRAAFDGGATELLERLERLRAQPPYKGATEPAALKEAIEHLRQMVGKKAAEAAAERAKVVPVAVAKPVAEKAPSEVKKPAPQKPATASTKAASERPRPELKKPAAETVPPQKPDKAREPVLPPVPTPPTRPDQPLDRRIYF